MDTEKAQEFSKEIAAKAAEKELRKQRYAEYQLKRQQTTRYDLPRPGSIPVPQLEKPKEKKEPRPQSVLSNLSTREIIVMHTVLLSEIQLYCFKSIHSVLDFLICIGIVCIHQIWRYSLNFEHSYLA